MFWIPGFEFGVNDLRDDVIDLEGRLCCRGVFVVTQINRHDAVTVEGGDFAAILTDYLAGGDEVRFVDLRCIPIRF